MKNYIIAIMVLTSLVLAGCSSNGDTGANWNTFIGGTDGVNMRFEVDSPPAEVNYGDEFKVLLVLKNLGEYTVPEGDYFVKIKGFSPEEFSTTSGALQISPTEDLQANEMNPDTGETIEAYEVFVDIPQDGYLKYKGGIAGNTQFPFAADLCYTYVTTANAKLCIKEDLRKVSDTDVCVLSGPQDITSSGAPIQIQNFKEFSGGEDAVRFSFDVVAANTIGKVSKREMGCSKQNSDVEKVFVTIDTGIAGLECSGFIGDESAENEGYIKLSNGVRQVTCTQDLTGQHDTDFIKIIEITAEYDFEQSINTNVLIKRIE